MGAWACEHVRACMCARMHTCCCLRIRVRMHLKVESILEPEGVDRLWHLLHAYMRAWVRRLPRILACSRARHCMHTRKNKGACTHAHLIGIKQERATTTAHQSALVPACRRCRASMHAAGRGVWASCSHSTTIYDPDGFRCSRALMHLPLPAHTCAQACECRVHVRTGGRDTPKCCRCRCW